MAFGGKGMHLLEFLIIIFGIIWVALAHIENAAGKNNSYGQYSWLAYAMRPLLFFCGVGLFLIFIGTDWQNAFWEHTAGILSIIIGFGIFGKNIFHRKKIQANLESGKTKPSGA